MRRKDIASLTPEQISKAVVIVRRISQFNKWRILFNGEDVVTNAEAYCLFSDLERVTEWLREAGIDRITIENGFNLA